MSTLVINKLDDLLGEEANFPSVPPAPPNMEYDDPVTDLIPMEYDLICPLPHNPMLRS